MFQIPDKGTVYRIVWNEVQTALADYIDSPVTEELLKLMAERIKGVLNRMSHEFPGFFEKIEPECEGVRDELDPTKIHITYIHARKKQIPEFEVVRNKINPRSVDLEPRNEMAKEMLEHIASR